MAEYILTKDAGLTRQDIHGVERRGRHVERRHDVAATVRRVFGRVGRRRTAGVIGAFGATIGVTALLAGVESVGLFLVSAWSLVASIAVYRYTPDVVFEPPAPKAIVTYEHEDGLTDDEYARRLAIHSERNDLKEERIEQRRKKQERKAKAGGGRAF